MKTISCPQAEKSMRQQLLDLLNGKNAHMSFDMVIADMDTGAINSKLPHFNYSIWHLLEHMRRAQKDILEFIKNADYETPQYSEFWPGQDETADTQQWLDVITSYSIHYTKLYENACRNTKSHSTLFGKYRASII